MKNKLIKYFPYISSVIFVILISFYFVMFSPITGSFAGRNYYKDALEAHKNGDYENALRLYEIAVEENPELKEAYYNMIIIYNNQFHNISSTVNEMDALLLASQMKRAEGHSELLKNESSLISLISVFVEKEESLLKSIDDNLDFAPEIRDSGREFVKNTSLSIYYYKIVLINLKDAVDAEMRGEDAEQFYENARANATIRNEYAEMANRNLEEFYSALRDKTI